MTRLVRGRRALVVLGVLGAVLAGALPASAARGGGPPYTSSAVINDENNCSATTCSSVGAQDAATGAITQRTSIAAGGGTTDGSGYSFVVREVSDELRVPDGWHNARLDITFSLEEATAALTGAYGHGDWAEAHLYVFASSSGCPSCSTSAPPFTISNHQGWTDSRPSPFARPPGTYTVSMRTEDPYSGEPTPLGTIRVGFRLLTSAEVGRTDTDAFGQLNLTGTPHPKRAANVSTRLTVQSIAASRAA
ncbi:MAG: hypothetical protein QOD30_38 [Actinomycetota bacterium]|nr:hypothetical protein [Actinomycetota bacterium]